MALIQRHTVYIRCRAPELWAALTEGQTSRHYYFNSLVESSFEPGAEIRYMVEADDEVEDVAPIVAIAGGIIAVESEKSLIHSMQFCDLDEPATTVHWTITHAAPGILRVDIEHDGFADANQTWERVDDGRPVIISGLKTWLETGEPLGLVGGGGDESSTGDHGSSGDGSSDAGEHGLPS